MNSNFNQFMLLREKEGEDGNKIPMSSKLKLQKREGTNEFAPFRVDKSSHPNLRLLIQAFSNSQNVGLGYTTVDKSKGENEPKLKKKTLYLTGGALRDHLKGKTPKNYDLVTDATVSEMRMILKNAEHGFQECKPKGKVHAGDDRYAELPEGGHKNKCFYITRWDASGKEMELTVEINGEKFHLSPMTKGSKSRRIEQEKVELATTPEEDSLGRDFTINSLYLPLTQSDGENTDLIDPHGGAHHLKNSEVNFIGNPSEKLKQDPGTAFRYMRIMSRYGNGKVPDKYKMAMMRHKDMEGVDKKYMRDEFLGGLEHPDVNTKKYLGSFKDCGLLNALFPGIEISTEDMPDEMKGDRWMTTAWLLKNNEDYNQIKKLLKDGGWSDTEANDISYLVKLAHWSTKKNFDKDSMYDLKRTHTGLTKAKIREWMQLLGKAGEHVDAFLGFDDKDLKKMIDGPEGKQINPAFIKHLGRMPRPHELESVRKDMTTSRWEKMLNLLKKKGGDEEGEDGKVTVKVKTDEKQEETRAWDKMVNLIGE